MSTLILQRGKYVSDKILFKGLCPPVNVCLLCVWFTYVCIHISSMCAIYMYVVLCICCLFSVLCVQCVCLLCICCMFTVYICSLSHNSQ